MTKIVVIDTDHPDVPHDLLHAIRLLTHKVDAIMATIAQLEADIAAQTQAIGGLQTAATAQLAAIQALRDQIASGGSVSDADLAALEANTQKIVDVTTGMAPTAGTIPVFNPNDSTPNGATMADGSTIRNTPNLPGFDSSRPQTT